ncbi:hypothetical protein KQI77_10045 [Clostridium sp. MSJ-8]|uniref:hypothetical protein n=1 Tax=Clostridium sp. MSJ-8 TaxID=2841510 RepID=UPI001C0ED31B|nr:hypothetical protein [Clostridium sp. MSJ-8]MBU5488470.1 hypothetical protein [Clostridium sp. MSJ-8]
MSGKHSFIREGKNLTIKFEGFYNEENAVNFMSDYNNAVSDIKNTKDSILVLDGKDLMTASPKLIPILKECFSKYDKEFGKVYLINPSTATAKMQMKRIAKEANASFEFVDQAPKLS